MQYLLGSNTCWCLQMWQAWVVKSTVSRACGLCCASLLHPCMHVDAWPTSSCKRHSASFFRMFYRVWGAASRAVPSLGFGLKLAARVPMQMQLHGGHMTARFDVKQLKQVWLLYLRHCTDCRVPPG